MKKDFLKPNASKGLWTLSFMILIAVIGIIFFNDLVWLNGPCLPNFDGTEKCRLTTPITRIRYFMLPLIVVLYMVACWISSFKRK